VNPFSYWSAVLIWKFIPVEWTELNSPTALVFIPFYIQLSLDQIETIAREHLTPKEILQPGFMFHLTSWSKHTVRAEKNKLGKQC